MRAYFFGNFYLSSIQQGIQAQHCTAEMFLKYEGDQLTANDGGPRRQLYEWAEKHKTSILLNGGDTEALWGVLRLLREEGNEHPWAHFNESYGALNTALTCVGIILPEEIYLTAEQLRKPEKYRDVNEMFYLTPWEERLCEAMNSCGLAR